METGITVVTIIVATVMTKNISIKPKAGVTDKVTPALGLKGI